MDAQAIARVVKFSERYRAEHFEASLSSPNTLLKGWWNALRFLLDRLLYYPNSKRTTDALTSLTETVLESHLDTKSPFGLSRASDDDMKRMKSDFKNGDIEVDSAKRDRFAHLFFGGGKWSNSPHGFFDFMKDLPEGNIVRHTISEIESGRLIPFYRTLRSLPFLPFLSHRAVSSYLRDIADLFFDQLEKHIRTAETQLYLQPIDSHIRRVAEAVGISFDGRGIIHQSERIVDACFMVSLSRRVSLRFTQGAHWLGQNCMKATLEMLRTGKVL